MRNQTPLKQKYDVRAKKMKENSKKRYTADILVVVVVVVEVVVEVVNVEEVVKLRR